MPRPSKRKKAPPDRPASTRRRRGTGGGQDPKNETSNLDAPSTTTVQVPVHLAAANVGTGTVNNNEIPPSQEAPLSVDTKVQSEIEQKNEGSPMETEGGNDHAAETDNNKADSQPEAAASTPTSDSNQPLAADAKQLAPISNDSKKEVVKNSTEDERTQLIRQILAHRKLLLERVQQTRAAAQSRMTALQDASKTTQSDEQEIVAFQEMTKKVTSDARKRQPSNSSSGDHFEPRRSSVSLRRGSSVGKRMSAALSSLGSGSHEEGLRGVSAADVSKNNPPTTQTAMPAPTIGMKRPRPGSGAGRGGGARQQQQQQGMVTSGRGAQSSMMQQGVASRSRIPGQRNSVQQQPMPYVPRVICPETRALRERRDAIRSKLERRRRSDIPTPTPREAAQKVFERRRSSLSISLSSPASIRSPTSSSVDQGRRLSLSSVQQGRMHQRQSPSSQAPRRPLWLGPDLPPRLPQRRKTHWDTLLDEMRWLATDFIEERNWKIVTGRALGNEVALKKAVDAGQKEQTVAPSGKAQSAEAPSVAVQEAEPVEVPQITPKPSRGGLSKDDRSKRNFSKSKKSEPLPVADTFQELTEDDKKVAKAVAEKLSSSIADHASSCSGASDLGVSTRLKVGTASMPAANESMRDAAADEEDHSKVRQTRFETATKHVEEILDRLKEKEKPPPKKKSKSASRHAKSVVDSHGFELSAAQTSVVGDIENRWQNLNVGAVFKGPMAGGKTIATCSVLWRKRSNGPQLVVCSFAVMLRWLHELGLFPDWKVQVLDPSSTPDWEEPGAVFVCLYSSVSQLSDDSIQQFRSLVVDCRHPSGFLGSRSPTIGEINQGDLIRSGITKAAPEELSQVAFWEKLASTAAQEDTGIDRLLIENSVSDAPLFYLHGKPHRQRLSVLALRVGLLFGTKVFASDGKALEKSILAWARHRVKGISTGPKFQRVLALLNELVEPFQLSTEAELQLKDYQGLAKWDIRACEMPKAQEAAYLDACREARSLFSRSFDVSESLEDDAFGAAAAAIVELRRKCAHADIRRMLHPNGRKMADEDDVCTGCVETSPSQPDLELARRMLCGSGKLQHLMSILLEECDLELPDESSPKDLGIEDKVTKQTLKAAAKSTPNNVVILCALPDVLSLVSRLLNAIGIQHHALLRPLARDKDGFPVDTVDGAATAWTKSQFALTAFDSETTDEESLPNIIVASPISLAGDHSGLGIGKSDLVISLDEDWSGRGELILEALTAQFRFRGESGRLIRLITARSCEESFVDADAVNAKRKCIEESETGVWAWPLTPMGLFKAPGTASPASKALAQTVRQFWNEQPRSYATFGFPGRNIFSKRDADIDEILVVKDSVPQRLAKASKLLFFPVFEREDPVDIEITLLKAIAEAEDAASFSTNRGSILVATLPPLSSGISDAFFGGSIRDASCKLFLTRMFDTEPVANIDTKRLVLPAQAALDKTGVANSDTKTILQEEFATAMDVDTDRPSDYVGTPGEAMLSLLFYKSRETSTRPREPKGRANLYSTVFSESCADPLLHDGNQGAESLVYFPPVFPRMQECARLARGDVRALGKQSHPSPEEQATHSNEKDIRATEQVGELVLAGPPRVVTEEEASQNDAASVLIDLSDDYGLAGMGAVPLPRDSALTARRYSHHPSKQTSTAGNNSWLAGTPTCDAEEAEAAMHADLAGDEKRMILFTSRKRPRHFAAAQAALHNRTQGRGSWTGISASASPRYSHANGSGQSASAFDRLPSMGSAPLYQRSKDSYRQRLLLTLRNFGSGSTMFEAPIFRIASVQVRKKVADAVFRQGWTPGPTYDAGPGLPLLVAKQHASSTGYRGTFEADPNLWTSIVKRLKNKDAKTGDEAMDQSLAQRASMRRSLVAPCRVDFGPFQCGFLSSTSGAASAVPHRTRPGVTLPMGVKIAPAAKDQPTAPWRTADDQELLASAVKFGMNWVLVARALSDFQDVSISSREAKGFAHQRSARSCRDRWQRLARSNPVIMQKVRQSERLLYRPGILPHLDDADAGERAVAKRVDKDADKTDTDDKEAPKKETVSVLFPSTKEPLKASDVASTEPEAVKSPALRKFAAIRSSKAKRQSVPMIPNLNQPSPTSISASHHSHDASVKNSVSAAWTGGQTDMWPLQLLDAADRHRRRPSPRPSYPPPPPSRAAAASFQPPEKDAAAGVPPSQPKTG